jgi:transcriptional regulator with XRE-family HTH domain
MIFRPGAADTGPTVRRMLLGTQLRQLREERGLTREQAGWHIRASESKISRMELGRVSFKERDVADLLTLYGVDDETERAALLTLARQANNPGWWHAYGDLLPTWFQAFPGLESAAAVIRTYEVQFVPGLLQTADYARAVIMLGYAGADEAEIERRVELRLTRQAILSRPETPRLWAVVDEAALRRAIGGPSVMRAQIEHLIAACEHPNVNLQIVPFHVGGHAGAGGAFTILRFAEPDLPDVVYIEQLASALYLDKRDDVDNYVAAMERLCVQALPPADTPALLRKLLDEFDADSA